MKTPPKLRPRNSCICLCVSRYTNIQIVPIFFSSVGGVNACAGVLFQYNKGPQIFILEFHLQYWTRYNHVRASCSKSVAGFRASGLLSCSHQPDITMRAFAFLALPSYFYELLTGYAPRKGTDLMYKLWILPARCKFTIKFHPACCMKLDICRLPQVVKTTCFL